jgi:hypothetical protein
LEGELFYTVVLQFCFSTGLQALRFVFCDNNTAPLTNKAKPNDIVYAPTADAVAEQL